MKNTSTVFGIAALALAIVISITGLSLTGCPTPGPTPVKVASVTLSETSLTMTVGEEKTLTAIIAPSNADNQNVEWSSNAPSVVEVANGKVTAKTAGTGTITVTTQDGGKTATCSVTVTPAAPTTYAITMQNDGHGTARASPNPAEVGAVVTITATRNSGYSFESWQVVSGGVTLTHSAANPAVFTMPNNAVTIKAVFAEIPPNTPSLNITPPTFDNVTIGYAAQTEKNVTITNEGTGTANITGIALDADGNIAFTLGGTSSITTVAVDGTAAFTVQPKTGLAVGRYEGNITVTYDSGKTAQAVVSFTVTSGSTQGTAPAITTPSLPNGTVNAPYSQTLQATGTTPITWTLDNGTLPTGLNLAANGVISGTPTTANTYTFTVKAANAAGSVTKQLSIIINAAPLPKAATPVASPSAGTFTTAQNVTLTTTTADAQIYYTTNGTNPTASSTLYSGAINISATTTLKAIAVKDGMNNSDIMTAVYTLNLPITLTENVWADGNLSYDSSVQWYKFTATASTQYIHAGIAITGTANHLLVQVYDSSGNPVGEEYRLYINTEISVVDTYVSRNVTAGQEYNIRVRLMSYAYSGTYQIAFNRSSVSPPSNAITLTENTLADGNLPTSSDVQWFKFTATANTQYIHVGFGTLTFLYVQVYDSSGVEIGSAKYFYSSITSDSRTVTAGQEYYIEVRSSGSYSGTYKIGFNDSTTPPTPAITVTVPGADLAAKLAWLKSNAQSNTGYLVTVDKAESLAGTYGISGDNYLAYGENTNIAILLTGDHTVSLSSNGSLFWIGSGVTLVLEQVTLNGRSNNSYSLVRIDGGTLEMRTGATISGNTSYNSGSTSNRESDGGGVYMADGTFTMSGGKISGNVAIANSSSGRGGGVYVAGGTFTMSGGEISGNTAQSNGNYTCFGGGVCVWNNGTFIKSGGTITGYGDDTVNGNRVTATGISSLGHAVYVASGYKTKQNTSGPDNNLDSRVAGAAGGWDN